MPKFFPKNEGGEENKGAGVEFWFCVIFVLPPFSVSTATGYKLHQHTVELNS